MVSYSCRQVRICGGILPFVISGPSSFRSSQSTLTAQSSPSDHLASNDSSCFAADVQLVGETNMGCHWLLALLANFRRPAILIAPSSIRSFLSLPVGRISEASHATDWTWERVTCPTQYLRCTTGLSLRGFVSLLSVYKFGCRASPDTPRG